MSRLVKHLLFGLDPAAERVELEALTSPFPAVVSVDKLWEEFTVPSQNWANILDECARNERFRLFTPNFVSRFPYVFEILIRLYRS
jgi:hypothetical protein